MKREAFVAFGPRPLGEPDGRPAVYATDRQGAESKHGQMRGYERYIPADSPNVLSEEEARLLTIGAATAGEKRAMDALLERLSDFAKEGSDRG